jgi:MoaA/NifB/PqqE/SkfB family radical SAM enzyme
LQINHIDFLLTFKCPAECQHCSYKAGPKRSGCIKPKDAKRYLEELTKIQPLKSIWVHGGEPFLYFDCLEHLIKEAKKLDITRIGVITNSFWAKNEKITKRKLERLQDVGLTSLTLSFDFFHQEFIPLEYVKNALKSAVNIEFEDIFVDSYFVGDINSENYFNQFTKKNLEKLDEIEGVEFHRLPMRVEGRGIELAEHINLKNDIPSGNCPLPFWIEGNLENPDTIEIDFEGNVTLCPGISIGNTNIQSLTKIIQNYNVNSHSILSTIWKEGPIGLLKIAKEQGFQESQYANECHLCYELRKFLQPIYPFSLAPKECY